jgi:hypothetical protein
LHRAQPYRHDKRLLHVDREGVECERPADGQTDRKRGFPLILHQPLHGTEAAALCRAGIVRDLRGVLGRRRFLHPTLQHESEHSKCCADQKRNAPAPCLKLLWGQQHLLQHQKRNSGEQLTEDDGDKSERTVEPAEVRGGGLAQKGSAAAVGATERSALQERGRKQCGRCQFPDLRVGRTDSDDQASGAHQHHRHHEGLAPPTPIRVAAEEPAADRTHDETNREDAGNVQKSRTPDREERLGEIEREDGVEIERVPSDEIGQGPRDHRRQSMAEVHAFN